MLHCCPRQVIVSSRELVIEEPTEIVGAQLVMGMRRTVTAAG